MQLPENFQYNNQIIRYGDKNSLWAVGHQWEYKGNIYKVVHYGSWRTGETSTWKSYDEKDASPAFKKSEKDQLSEIKETLDLETKKKHDDCASKWLKEWNDLSAAETVHPYLLNKNISDNHGAKTGENGQLLIKIQNEFGIVGVQIIYYAENAWQKRFSTGIKKKASFGLIGELADVVYLAEGFATAATVHEATGLPCVMAIDAGNMFPAIQTLRKINPKMKIIICADVDKNRVGIMKAQACKKFFSNVIIKEPKFTLKTTDQTDFNDLHTSETIEVVAEQLAFTDNDFIHIKYLGYGENEYFYSSSENANIVRMSPPSHKKLNLFDLAPESYWKTFYPKKDEDEGQASVPYDTIASDMMTRCRNAGMFNPENVRGLGIWPDKGVFTLNTGAENIPEVPKSDFYYQRMAPLQVDFSKVLGNEESRKIMACFHSLHTDQAAFLAAWLVQSQIFACLPWRFHVWINGRAGSGKTTVLEWIEKLAVISKRTENATASGIVQYIKNNACPIIYDETEVGTGRMKGVIEIARQSSTASGGQHMRGTAHGKSNVNNTKSVFLFASIQAEKLESADLTRFLFVEMKDGLERDEYLQVKSKFEELYGYRDQFFTRCINSVPSVLKSIAVAQDCLAKTNLSARQCDQLASMLACWWVYYSMEPITVDECEQAIEMLNLVKSNYVEQNEGIDEEDCLNELLSVEYDNQNHNIAQALDFLDKSPLNSDEADGVLGTFGLKYYPKEKQLFLASKCDKLRNKMKTNQDYVNILRRSSLCVNVKDLQRVKNFGTKAVRGIRVTLV